MNPFEWLASQANANQTNLQRLAELISVNGDTMIVKVVNKVVPDEGKYKRKGLTLSEALELCFMRGCLEGNVKAHGEQFMAPAHDLIMQEIHSSSIVIASSLETRVFGRKAT